MTRNRIFVAGCLGSIVLIVALVAIIYFAQRGPYELARSRWNEKGSGNYTLVVSEVCFCPNAGEVKLTVQSGRVTAVEPTDPPSAIWRVRGHRRGSTSSKSTMTRSMATSATTARTPMAYSPATTSPIRAIGTKPTIW